MDNSSEYKMASHEAVIRKYANMVYKLAFAMVRTRSDADDIFQEVFMRYIKKAPVFNSDEHRKAWLIRVTINCAKKHFSSPWLQKTVPLDDNILFLMPEENGLHEALKKLAPKYRAVIHLFYYEGYKVDEIGRLLARKPSTVRTQLTRAREKLSKILKEES